MTEMDRKDRLRREYRDATSVMYGALLGDLNVSIDTRGRTPRAKIEQGTEHLDWLRQIHGALEVRGVKAPKDQPKIARRKGKLCAYLQSYTSPSLLQTYYEWTKPDGEKRLPRDFWLNALSLAHWFMGDGSTTFDKRTQGKVELTLSSNAFSREDNVRLQKRLERDLRIGIGLYSKMSRGKRVWYLRTANSTTVNSILDLVEPHLAPSFSFKVKRPRLRGKVWRDGGWVTDNQETER